MKLDNYKFDQILAKRMYTSKELSNLSGVSCVTLSRIKNNKQIAKPITIGKLAKALNVEVKEIIE